jgi:hypothetical protein
VSIREHTLAYVRIGEDRGGPVLLLAEEEEAVSVDEDAEPEPKSTTAHMRIPTAEFAPLFRAAASGKGSPARFQSAARIQPQHTFASASIRHLGQAWSRIRARGGRKLWRNV